MKKLDWRPARALGVYTRRSGPTTLIETYHDGYAINSSAAYIWSRIDGDRTLGQVADQVAAKYDLDADQAATLVGEFVQVLLEKGFVAPR